LINDFALDCRYGQIWVINLRLSQDEHTKSWFNGIIGMFSRYIALASGKNKSSVTSVIADVCFDRPRVCAQPLKAESVVHSVCGD
jgi:hypothetical protein